MDTNRRALDYEEDEEKHDKELQTLRNKFNCQERLAKYHRALSIIYRVEVDYPISRPTRGSVLIFNTHIMICLAFIFIRYVIIVHYLNPIG